MKTFSRFEIGGVKPSVPVPLGNGARAFTLVELLVVVAIVAVLAGLLLPTLGRAKAKGLDAVCVSHLRQLGIATRTYAEDHHERLPSAELLPTLPVNPREPLPRICDLLAGYVGRVAGTNAPGSAATVFRCPADRKGRFAAEGSSYEWNIDLNGHRIDETRTDSAFLLLKPGDFSGGVTNFFVVLPPETTPLLLDYEEFHPRPPNSGKNVVYMDGHVAPLRSSRD
ncbi:MAG: prepilin-type N-terminal cleavage/methylation domain-containing protein [Verrucomicrobiota bacterium]